MRTIVVGAGTVGTNIAAHLARDRHDVVVVDLSQSKLRDLEDHVDVQTLLGNACDPQVLKQAIGGHQTALLLAVTDQDTTNLIVAYAAKRVGLPRVVARVRSRFFLDGEAVNFSDPLGIDMLMSPEILTAQELANFIEHPNALYSASLARGRLELRTLFLSPLSELCSLRLREITLPAGCLVAAIRRGSEIHTPRGDDELQAGDRITLIGLPDVLDDVHNTFDTEQTATSARGQRVAIAGAGETGLFLAEMLETRRHKVYLIDKDIERCNLAGERLKHAIVYHGDCTNVQFLREEHLERMDYFVAVTGDDESNVMSALLAKELGIERTACIIDRPDYIRIVERVGIDAALSPRIVAANRVMAVVKQGKIRNVVLIEDGAVEVTEYQAQARSPITGVPLKDLDMPKGTLVGAIVRGQKVIIPRGDDMIKGSDVVIAVAESQQADKVDKLFRPE
ncbi:MAG: Trk system potassium transporter TrkA [Sumerlaeia bacterium]